MAARHFAVRSPTGRAWLGAAVGIILGGEIYWELRKETPANFFHIPFTDGELWVWVTILLALGVASLVWLLALYLRPGALTLDAEAGLVVRRRRPFVRTEELSAPLAEWRVRLRFFDEEQQRRGVFKRLVLARGDFEEVLLFADLARGEALALALAEHADRFAEWRVELDVAQVPAR